MNFSAFAAVIGFLRKEFSQVLRDSRMRIILLVIPVMQMAVFGLAISTEVKNIKLGTAYNPNDTILRRIEERSFSSKWFIPAVGRGTSSDANADPLEQIRSGRADVVLISPPGGLTKAIERGERNVQLLIDASNVIRAQSIERYMQSIINEVLRDDFHLSARTPVIFDVRILYNPSLESAIFMVPGTLAMILCIVTILLTSMSIAREKEMGTFEMIISAPVKTWEVLLGKTIPFIVIGMLNAASVFIFAILVFKVPMKGFYWQLAIATFSFVVTTVSIGTLISTFAKNQQQAMMGGFIFLLLSNLLAGIMFPIDNMPLLMKAAAYMNPMTYFVRLVRNIMLKGGSPDLIWSYIAILVLMAVLASIVSYKRFHHTLD
ncbi:MAG: ABC transporter permease [Deltaproteobacteria bacterium]|nr:ABC transporter permease [Deltaproteobacteria bacterium]